MNSDEGWPRLGGREGGRDRASFNGSRFYAMTPAIRESNKPKERMLRLSKRGREGLHTVMLNRLGLLTRMRARMGMEPSSGRGVPMWMSTTYWGIKEEGRDEKKWCGGVNGGRKL